MEEVGLGQCDVYCLHHVWSVMSSSSLSFSDDEADLSNGGTSQLANVLVVEDGFRPLALQKLS